MSWADCVNGGFESLSGFFVLLSCLKTLKNKSSRGVSWITVAFFALWGYWNLYYYPSLNQIASFIGGLVVVSVNTWWVILLIKYRKE